MEGASVLICPDVGSRDYCIIPMSGPSHKPSFAELRLSRQSRPASTIRYLPRRGPTYIPVPASGHGLGSRTPIGIIGDDQRAHAQSLLDQRQDVRIKPLRAIQQYKIDRLRQVLRQRFQCIAFTYFDEIGKAAGSDIRARPRDLCPLDSLVMSLPPPLSRSAAARCKAETPNEVPNSIIVLALVARASMYSSLPVSRDPARWTSFARE